MAIKGRLVAGGLAAALLAAGIAGQVLPDAPDTGEKPALGLLTSLPIFWSESDGIDEALNGGGETHWARTALERDNRLVTLDTLDGEDLSSIDRLIMAQPRPLAPGENVSLDDWVRAGGKVLLFADPMLTEHSRFVIGDRRRPQDVVVLSPILKRWGLELQFDEDQPDGVRMASGDGLEIPVEWAGTLVPVEPGAPSQCALSMAGLMAECRVGKGEVTVIADVAVLDRESGRQTGTEVLLRLVSRAFD